MYDYPPAFVESKLFESTKDLDITTDKDGFIYLTFTTENVYPLPCSNENQQTGITDIVVMKLDSSFNYIWTKQSSSFNTPNKNTNPKICLDHSKHLYIAYFSRSKKENVVILFELNSDNGETILVKEYYNSSLSSNYLDLGLDSIGNIYLFQQEDMEIIVNKIEPLSLSILWKKQQCLYYCLDEKEEQHPVTNVDDFGNVYIAYSTQNETKDLVIFKLNTDGDFQWVKQNSGLSGNNIDNYSFTKMDRNGNIFVIYDHENIICIYNLDPNGNLLWLKNIDNFIKTISQPKITLDSSQNIYVNYNTIEDKNMILLKLNINGDLIWKLNEESNIAEKIICVKDDIYISFPSTLNQSNSSYITKYTYNQNHMNQYYNNEVNKETIQIKLIDIDKEIIQIQRMNYSIEQHEEDEDDYITINQRRYRIQFSNFANQMNFRYMIPIQFYFQIANMDEFVDNVIDRNGYLFNFYEYDMLHYYI